MQMLNYHYPLGPAEEFSAGGWSEQEILPLQDEIAVAEELLDALSDEQLHFDFDENASETKLRALIDAKLAGDETVASPRTEPQPRVINFQDALRRGVDRAHSTPFDAASRRSTGRDGTPRRPLTRRRRSG